MAFALPDCTLIRPVRGLSPRQRRELVRLLAEEGTAGLEAWLRKEEARDPTIRERLEEERARLEREARAERQRLLDQHAAGDADAESAWERRMRELREREEALRDRLETVRSPPVLSRDQLVAGSPLYHAVLAGEGGPRSVWRRVGDALRRFWILVVSLWVRFVRWVTGRKANAPRHVVTLPGGAELDLARGLGPDAMVALREDSAPGWRERLRRAWDRLLGREDYAEAVARLMEEERRRLEERLRREQEAEAKRLEEALAATKGTEDAQARERDADRTQRRRRREDALADLARRQQDAPYEALREGLVGELRMMGLLDERGHVTSGLLQRFSKLLYEEVAHALPTGGQTTPGTYVEGRGEYEMGPLRSSHEIGAMDLVSSLVHARLHHPHVRHIYDDDILVHREVRSATAHVVLVFDTSGSMEGARLEAAKRVCLVLHQAVKDRNPDHRVDLVRMHTSVEHVDLAACWDSEPQGFTNHGAAMRLARRLFEAEGADHKVLYLVTDGLPEAYTKEDGTDKADRPDICMEDALAAATGLRAVPGLRTVVLQLETEDPLFLEAAGQIAQAAGGHVEGIPPERLAEWIVGDFQATPLGPPSEVAV